jgi:hypothetical protein
MVACVSWKGEYRVVPPAPSVAEEGGRRRYGRDYHGEANAGDAEEHPVDAELARRLPRAAHEKRIRAAQRRLLATLGRQAALYLEVERLVAERARERETAAFNLGYERGRLEGRTEATASQRDSQRLATRLAQLAAQSAGAGEPLTALLHAALAVARRR